MGGGGWGKRQDKVRAQAQSAVSDREGPGSELGASAGRPLPAGGTWVFNRLGAEAALRSPRPSPGLHSGGSLAPEAGAVLPTPLWRLPAMCDSPKWAHAEQEWETSSPWREGDVFVILRMWVV